MNKKYTIFIILQAVTGIIELRRDPKPKEFDSEFEALDYLKKNEKKYRGSEVVILPSYAFPAK